MSKKLLLQACLLAASCLCAEAQQSSFEEFRKSLISGYSSFRDGILADYAKFLDGVWVEYNGFRAEARDEQPKPPAMPVADNTTQQAPVARIPSPAKPVLPAPPATPSAPDVRPTAPVISKHPQPTPASPAPEETFTFSYHGIDMEVPAVEFRIMDKVSAPADFAAQWRALDNTPAPRKAAENLKALASARNFNDYLTYDLASSYALARFPDARPSSRTSLVHYMLAQMGYDARIGVNSGGQALLMLPCRQMVYGHMYLMFGNEKYFVFSDPEEKLSATDTRISTCTLPEAAATASKFDLRLGAIDIPLSPKPFHISANGIEISGETNANLYPILYRYPQIPVTDYAASDLMPTLRRDIVEQLKEQLAGLDSRTAVDKLLQFVQSGFEYATDGDFHGFEKPYFFEEMLYYDKCDCEDRVIFYTYLLWNVLGVENHLLAYPGHESAAVALDDAPARGDSYNYDGRTFFISDPTYIGAKTGMCMPSFRDVSPEIDHIYR